MEAKGSTSISSVALFIAGVLCFAVTPLFAQVEIPEGSIITRADLSVMALDSTGETVNVHRITSDWGECSVKWSTFSDGYDLAVVDSFIVTFGWNTADITAVAQAWVDGTVSNFGVLLRQGTVPSSQFWSSEYEFNYDRPKLEIWFVDPSGNSGYALIQRPDAAQGGVADAYIWQLRPDDTYCGGRTLYAGLADSFEKLSLIRFNFTVSHQAPGTGTPGYWKNHSEAWPTETVTIGGVLHQKPDAIVEMKAPTKGDKTRTMFKALVATKLNIMIGNDPSCISDAVATADAWMVENPLGSKVKGNSSAWSVGEPIKDMLDDYNNGRLPCADYRD